MGCTFGHPVAGKALREALVNVEEEEVLVPPKGSWTPIVAIDCGSSLSEKEAHKDLEGSDLQTLQIQALSVLAMLPGCGDTDANCAREAHGFLFGSDDGAIADLSDTYFDGFLGLVNSYRDAASSATIGSSSQRSFASAVRHSVLIAAGDVENLDGRNHVVVILTNGGLAADTFHETVEAIRQADAAGLGVVCVGIGREFFGVFLEETLPELCRNFRFLPLEISTGRATRRPASDRYHCASAIHKAAVMSLTKPAAARPSAKLKRTESRLAKMFCGSCGRLPSSVTSRCCASCSASTPAAAKEGDASVTLFASSAREDMASRGKAAPSGQKAAEEADAEEEVVSV